MFQTYRHIFHPSAAAIFHSLSHPLPFLFNADFTPNVALQINLISAPHPAPHRRHIGAHDFYKILVRVPLRNIGARSLPTACAAVVISDHVLVPLPYRRDSDFDNAVGSIGK